MIEPALVVELQLVSQRDEPKPAPREKQTVLPFNPKL